MVIITITITIIIIIIIIVIMIIIIIIKDGIKHEGKIGLQNKNNGNKEVEETKSKYKWIMNKVEESVAVKKKWKTKGIKHEMDERIK